MISINKTKLDRPETQDYILTDLLQCDSTIQLHNIRTVTPVFYGVISFFFVHAN